MRKMLGGALVGGTLAAATLAPVPSQAMFATWAAGTESGVLHH